MSKPVENNHELRQLIGIVRDKFGFDVLMKVFKASLVAVQTIRLAGDYHYPPREQINKL